MSNKINFNPYKEVREISFVKYDLSNHIAVLTLNRPDSANALSHSMLESLNDRLTDIQANLSVRCVVITGAKEKAFCAGADLKERRAMTDDQVIKTVESIGQTISALENLSMPVIAAINGAAFGGGLELALACDLRIVAAHARMGLSETSLAIIPGAGGTQRLPRLIGSGRAKEMIYTAKSKTAEEALHIGLVEKVTPSDQLLDSALKMAATIAGNGPVAIRQAKKTVDMGMQTDLTTGLQIESQAYKHTIPTADRLEGLEAFKTKRNPEYKGK